MITRNAKGRQLVLVERSETWVILLQGHPLQKLVFSNFGGDIWSSGPSSNRMDSLNDSVEGSATCDRGKAILPHYPRLH